MFVYNIFRVVHKRRSQHQFIRIAANQSTLDERANETLNEKCIRFLKEMCVTLMINLIGLSKGRNTFK